MSRIGESKESVDQYTVQHVQSGVSNRKKEDQPKQKNPQNQNKTKHTKKHPIWTFFFSVLRLCGSRQVVAHCRADERIVQMQLLCPALGSRKWSEDHYAVQSLAGPKKEKPRSNQAQTHQSKQNQPKTKQEKKALTRQLQWGGR